MIFNRLIKWAVLLAIWLLLVFKTDVANIIVGGIAAALTIIGFAIGAHYMESRFEVPQGWLQVYAKIPAITVKDSARILWLLLSGKTETAGELASRPFDYGNKEPEDAGRLAMSIYAISVTPNTLVLTSSIDSIIIHKLSQAPEVRDSRWPV